MQRQTSGLFSQTTGQHGPELVLVHGWGMHSAVWGDFAGKLAQHYRVTQLDLPGHGRSACDGEFSLDRVTDALLQVAPPRAHWLGWSLGSLMVLNLAHRHPGRVASLTLVAGSARFTADSDWPVMDTSLLERFAADFAEDYAGSLRRFLLLQNLGQEQAGHFHRTLARRILACEMPEPRALQGGLEILKTADMRKTVQTLDCPLLLLLGARDRLASRDLASAMRALNPRCETHVLETAGHLPFLTHTEATLDRINDFLARQHA